MRSARNHLTELDVDLGADNPQTRFHVNFSLSELMVAFETGSTQKY